MVRQIKSLLVVVLIFFTLLQLISFIGVVRSYAETNYPHLYKKTSHAKEYKIPDSHKINQKNNNTIKQPK
ncbi:MAG: hypothetical protein D8M58_10680 [Calditrichaeota bacterium]|nr:MAG: hypothetical protein DWQ03_10055 [Calditrichota bacterium]MBL1205856.1 hypothetical protein [Calditrichota bacterium]NOG45684.1 hypothetical protein [Calditrichota bacterium]